MTSLTLRTAAGAALVALVLAVALPPQARSQVQVQMTPNFAPMGVAASGNSSTAWFFEGSTGRAMACQTAPVAGGLSPIQCVTVKLPRVEP
jgi:hypothetical protein